MKSSEVPAIASRQTHRRLTPRGDQLNDIAESALTAACRSLLIKPESNAVLIECFLGLLQRLSHLLELSLDQFALLLCLENH